MLTVHALDARDINGVDVGQMIVTKWHFIAILDEEKNIDRLLIHQEHEDAEKYATEFLKVFDRDLERKLPLEEYLFSFDPFTSDDRYASVRRL